MYSLLKILAVWLAMLCIAGTRIEKIEAQQHAQKISSDGGQSGLKALLRIYIDA